VIERPLRKSAQFTPEKIETLRFAPAMQDIMAWVYEKFEDEVYTNLKDHKEFIEEYIEREKIELNPKNQKALLDPKTWQAQLDIMNAGESLMKELGQEQYDDFNLFSEKLEEATKKLKLKLSASEKNQIINAISWRNESAAKIVKKVHKLSPAKLKDVLEKLNITEDKLQDYGYWKTKNTGEYIEYEADSELRDTENIPLKQDIHDYFIKEVRAHVDEAWIDISKTQIGYEISFNRYFYQHQPLRSLDEVTADILKLEEETDGLLKKLISLAANPKNSEAA
jgi:type I restriction enzyme M protein